jgi:hypothetical protein
VFNKLVKNQEKFRLKESKSASKDGSLSISTDPKADQKLPTRLLVANDDMFSLMQQVAILSQYFTVVD